ncbi:hypothetical protein HMPREF9554_00954 [Treponema phagedenis F0421]|nr:hypothetical protein HMPREF9554_00954 [Treponema phagedenis F0421]
MLKSERVWTPVFPRKKQGSVQVALLCAQRLSGDGFWRAELWGFSWRQRGVGFSMVNLPTVALCGALFIQLFMIH